MNLLETIKAENPFIKDLEILIKAISVYEVPISYTERVCRVLSRKNKDLTSSKVTGAKSVVFSSYDISFGSLINKLEDFEAKKKARTDEKIVVFSQLEKIYALAAFPNHKVISWLDFKQNGTNAGYFISFDSGNFESKEDEEYFKSLKLSRLSIPLIEDED